MEEKKSTRNIKNEVAWAKKKYRKFEVRIDKEFGDEFKAALDEDSVKLTDFFVNSAKKYMESREK